ncbi:MAG: UxaA family hydrolase [Rhodospirillaceae bacterium]|jgi:altronate dehydratase small subunit|nr:UxaA family hydrolase [Rhodospirillaceae bacterium]
MSAQTASAIRLHGDDHVATALRALKAGETVRLANAGDIAVSEDIGICHKFAVVAVATGERVKKYGEVIGVASADIAPGEHVHVHNLESLRAQNLASQA